MPERLVKAWPGQQDYAGFGGLFQVLEVLFHDGSLPVGLAVRKNRPAAGG